MFAQCEKLETIYCEDDWSSKTKLTASEGMFWRNTSLQGGKGTKFTSANPGDVTYAHPDGGTVNPGYFTVVPKEIYTEFVEATGTLTYYYDANRKFHTGITEVYDPVNKPNVLRFESYHGQVEKAVMDVSMKNAPLTSTYNMFFGGGATCTLSKLTAIEGLANLNTENVTDMSQMFYNCLKLTSLDLSLFNTAKVTNMKSMFNNCQSLVTIYCNDDWSQSTVLTSSSSMFNACYKLVGENGTNCNGVSNVGITYARPDNGPDSSQPGYFTRADEAIEDIEAPKDKARKVITDGQLFIALPDGAIYDLQGTKVK